MYRAYPAKHVWENGNCKTFEICFQALNTEILSRKGPPYYVILKYIILYFIYKSLEST